VTWSDITTSPESGNATEFIRSQQANPLLHFKLPSPKKSIEFLPRGNANGHDDNEILAKQDFDVYKDVIEMYTKKQLSYSTDILNALAGILVVVRSRIGGELVAGCATRYLDLSLLWNATEPADRRTAVGAGGSMFQAGPGLAGLEPSSILSWKMARGHIDPCITNMPELKFGASLFIIRVPFYTFRKLLRK
jgi:hypothetical protein